MSDMKAIHPKAVTEYAASLLTNGWHVGELRQDGFGRIYRCVQNAEAATAFKAKYAVAWKAQTTLTGECIYPTGSGAYDIAGIAQSAIPVDYYGWVLCSGHGSLICDTTTGVDVVVSQGIIAYSTGGKGQGYTPATAAEADAVFAVAQEGSTSGTLEEISVFVKGIL